MLLESQGARYTVRYTFINVFDSKNDRLTLISDIMASQLISTSRVDRSDIPVLGNLITTFAVCHIFYIESYKYLISYI